MFSAPRLLFPDIHTCAGLKQTLQRQLFYNPPVLVSEFDYHLPAELIAQEPLPERAASRMLHLDRRSGAFRDCQFADLPDILRPDDLLVLNNTRVFPARLFGRRAGARSQPISPSNPAAKTFLKGKVEVLLTRQTSQEPNEWECLVHPGRKIGLGERIFFGPEEESALTAEITGRGTFGERTLRFHPVPDFFGTLERLGHVPLPPYIVRADRTADRDRYQTVYARERGSVAAPTAGLHFTPQILERIRGRGVEIAQITLHVGLGTFQPLHAEKVEDHKLHSEHFSISVTTADQLNHARESGRRIVAVGTTTVRTLEFAAADSPSGAIQSSSGEANLFIYPGYSFRLVGALLTNFHLPKSTLLMLVCAFAGREKVLSAYEHAVRDHYRFYSYGDCMFVE